MISPLSMQRPSLQARSITSRVTAQTIRARAEHCVLRVLGDASHPNKDGHNRRAMWLLLHTNTLDNKPIPRA
jgi:hypothetical protein